MFENCSYDVDRKHISKDNGVHLTGRGKLDSELELPNQKHIRCIIPYLSQILINHVLNLIDMTKLQIIFGKRLVWQFHV